MSKMDQCWECGCDLEVKKEIPVCDECSKENKEKEKESK